jgi:hypothetical protein
MIRRSAKAIAVIALMLVVGMASVAVAAPTAGLGTAAAGGAGAAANALPAIQAPWYAQWRPFPIWPVWGYVPENGTGLEYQLSYVSERNEVRLFVVNATAKPVTVTTPTALKTDFALWRNGKLVWRASADKMFAQAATNETFKSGEGRVYKETLPYLPAGTYFAQAYFVGETTWAPVAATYVRIQAPAYEPLQYTVEYLGAGWFNSSPRLRVTIKNASNRDIALPYQYGYQVLVKRPGAKDYLGTVGIGESIGTLAAGATRYIFVNLDGLEPGVYQADVRSNIGTGRYRVVAQTWFYQQ